MLRMHTPDNTDGEMKNKALHQLTCIVKRNEYHRTLPKNPSTVSGNSTNFADSTRRKRMVDSLRAARSPIAMQFSDLPCARHAQLQEKTETGACACPGGLHGAAEEAKGRLGGES